MAEDISNWAALDSFATTVAESLEARAEQLTLSWLDAVERSGAGSTGDGETAGASAATLSALSPDHHLSGHVPELVRAFAATLSDAPPVAADAAVDHELSRLVRLRRAQGFSLAEVLSELGLLGDVLMEGVLAEASAQCERVPGDAVLAVVTRFNRTSRAMVNVTLRLFEQDVVARRQIRASLLDTCARAVTHELRNRVNAARLSLAAYRGSREECREELLENLDASLKQLEDAVGDVFSVALVQARELPAASRLQPLSDLIEHLRRDFDDLALAGRVEVRVAPPVPDLSVDAGKVRLALLNLVTNAVKHADRAKPRRWVEICVVAGDQRDEWRVDVEDNGTGLSVLAREMGGPEDAAGSQDQRLAAPGELGIALASEVVRQLGGRLWIEADTPGEGTTVSFTMRATAVER